MKCHYAEEGSAAVAENLEAATISAVNLSEVVANLRESGMPESVIHQALDPLGLKIVPFDAEQAFVAGLLRTATKSTGLSLGDRACLSLGKSLGVPILTADKTWSKLSIGVMIKLIRA